jgi:cell division protein FtsL
MAQVQNQNSAARGMIIYLLVLLFVCTCSVLLISQRLQIARRGHEVSQLHKQAEQLKTQRCYLQLEVAERASYGELIETARRMDLDVSPPEQVLDEERVGIQNETETDR